MGLGFLNYMKLMHSLKISLQYYLTSWPITLPFSLFQVVDRM